MRTDTLWQGERRAARMHWWVEVLDHPAGVDGETMFDEILSLRFHFAPEVELVGRRWAPESAAAGAGEPRGRARCAS